MISAHCKVTEDFFFPARQDLRVPSRILHVRKCTCGISCVELYRKLQKYRKTTW